MSIDPRYDAHKIPGESPGDFQDRMDRYRGETQADGTPWKAFEWNGLASQGLPDPFSKQLMPPMPESSLKAAENGLMYISHRRSYAK